MEKDDPSIYLYMYIFCGEVILVLVAISIIMFIVLCRWASNRVLANQQIRVEEIPAPNGLDQYQIQNIPACSFRPDDPAIRNRDCAVCLAGFEANEKLRILPRCNHAFHVPCIDKWLQMHSNCPLCRGQIMRRVSSFVENGVVIVEIDRIQAQLAPAPEISINCSPFFAEVEQSKIDGRRRLLFRYNSMPCSRSSFSFTA